MHSDPVCSGLHCIRDGFVSDAYLSQKLLDIYNYIRDKNDCAVKYRGLEFIATGTTKTRKS